MIGIASDKNILNFIFVHTLKSTNQGTIHTVYVVGNSTLFYRIKDIRNERITNT
jgi:hypothetical protein